MKISQRNKEEVRILEVAGDVDFHSSPELRKCLQEVLEEKIGKLLINLKQVKYIDSSGLATFVEALQKMKRSNGKMILSDLTPAVRGVFEIAKLDRVFSLVETEGEAFGLLAV